MRVSVFDKQIRCFPDRLWRDIPALRKQLWICIACSAHPFGAHSCRGPFFKLGHIWLQSEMIGVVRVSWSTHVTQRIFIKSNRFFKCVLLFKPFDVLDVQFIWQYTILSERLFPVSRRENLGFPSFSFVNNFRFFACFFFLGYQLRDDVYFNLLV